MQRVLAILGETLRKNRSLLDAGCGAGEYLSLCRKRTSFETGVDISSSYLKRVRNLCGDQLFLVRGSLESLPFKDSCFDVILCSEVLEHVTNLTMAINELFRVAKSNIIITMPNYGLARMFGERVPRIDMKRDDKAVGHIHIFPLKKLCENLNNENWRTESKTWHIYYKPMVSLRIPVGLHLIISFMETILDFLLPKLGNHSFILCKKIRS